MIALYKTQMMKDLHALQSETGPFISLYLDTEANKETGRREIALRWRRLAGQLGDDVSEKALLTLEDLVEGIPREGAGLVAITAGDGLAFTRLLSSPIEDRIVAGPLPDLLPLLEWKQDRPTYALVVADRAGADIHLIRALRPEVTVEIEGDHDELRKVHAGGSGGWSQRRFQQRAEDSWERNAEEVAVALQRLVEAEGIELVLIVGDVRAVSFIKDNANSKVAESIRSLDVAPSTADALDEIRGDVDREVAAIQARATEEILGSFHHGRKHGQATDGPEATSNALKRGQVDTLLLVTGQDLQRSAWFSPTDATQISLDREELDAAGLDDAREGALADVLVRTALGTGARITTIPSTVADEPGGGVGAILRYPD